MLAIPRHFLSWDYTLVDGNALLAEIAMSTWREKGTLTIAGTSYRLYRESLFSGAFVLDANGTVLVRAEKPNAMTRRMVIDLGGTQYELKPRSLFSRGFQLLKDDAVVGTLSASTLLGRRMEVELPESLPLPIRAFVVWLAILLWKRDANAG